MHSVLGTFSAEKTSTAHFDLCSFLGEVSKKNVFDTSPRKEHKVRDYRTTAESLVRSLDGLLSTRGRDEKIEDDEDPFADPSFPYVPVFADPDPRSSELTLRTENLKKGEKRYGTHHHFFGSLRLESHAVMGAYRPGVFGGALREACRAGFRAFVRFSE